MKVRKYLRALLCLYLTLIIAMDAVKAQTLKVGDTLPPELWSMPLQVINHPTGKETLTLSEYKDKLIILDFWATWCSPCIAMLPKQDSLQKQFKDQLQILPVTYQTGEEVSTFMEKYEKRKGIKNGLPKVVGDNVLRAAFPHTYLPHYVWIDAGGTVKAITGLEEVKTDKVVNFISNDSLVLALKEDIERIPYDPSSPFLIDNNGGDGNKLIYHSLLSGYTDGFKAGLTIKMDSVTGDGKLTFLNVSPYWLYRTAFGADSVWLGRNRFELQLNHSQRIMYNGMGETYTDWKRKYAYSYELILPNSSRSELFTTLGDDLKRMFPDIEAYIEPKERLCWVLSQVSGCELPQATEGKSFGRAETPGYILQNAPLKFFVSHMNRFILEKSELPLIDETGITYPVSLDITTKLTDIDKLSQELEKYGLKLSREHRVISVLVLKDKKHTKS